MHCELLVPAMFPRREPGAEPPRLAALELLLARGRRRSTAPLAPEAWLAQAFGGAGTPVAAGALTLLADGADAGEHPGGDCWTRADPVHLRVESDRLALVPSAAFAVARDEADSLAAAINRHFAGQLTLRALRPDRWCARLAANGAPAAGSPLELAGRDVNAILAQGPDGKRWHALLNEIQMVLHAHPVNLAREARGAPAINSVWLWGGGALPEAARAPWRSLAADDPVALGWARHAGIPAGALPGDASGWLAHAGREGRHLVVLDALRAPRALGDRPAWIERLCALEARWFAPLGAALRSGRVGMVTIHAPDAGVSFETIRADLRRFWRRPRALGVLAAE